MRFAYADLRRKFDLAKRKDMLKNRRAFKPPRSKIPLYGGVAGKA